MKKRFAAVLTSLLLIMLLVPTAAFATGGHTVNGNLDLTSGTTNTTLENDGYTWDASTHTLTMQDLTVTGNINLPNAECTINVKGNCSVGEITRNTSAAAQAVTIEGETGATLQSNVRISGALTIKNLTMTEGTLENGNIGNLPVLTLINSNITLHHLSWMTDGGIDLANSQLTVNKSENSLSQFWVEKIAMDENSVIESYRPMQNYWHFTPEDMGTVNDYIAVPAGGSFAKKAIHDGSTDTPLTVVDKEGNVASHFILRAPKEQCEISLKASPAEGGTVSGAGSYNMTSTATVKAEANKGYHFVQWQDEDGTAVSKDASYTFQVTQTQTLTAVFAKDSVTPTQPGSSDQGGSDDNAVATGDSSHMELWIALLAASILGIAGTVVFRRRKA